MSEYEVINGIRSLPRDVPLNTLLALGGVGEGRTYYVNNQSGASGNDGLSWTSAMDEVTTAITSSETYRALKSGSDNDYIMNTIFIQGTGTAYKECTTFPNYTNVIGLGANPYGNGTGIVRIGLDTHTAGTLGGGMYSAGDCRGSYFYNIQFQASNNRSCIKVKDIYRTTFENCAFFSSGKPVAPPDCGFEITGNAGGLRLINCHTGTNSSVNSEPWIGLKINGSYFMNCEVTDCSFSGMTAGIYVVGTCVYGWHSIVRHCFIGEGSQECAIGIDDNATVGTIVFYDCFIRSADPVSMAEDGQKRVIGCHAANALLDGAS